ncbi:DUF5005 domain-containing protein [Kribbella sp. NBC_01245]|uniref:fibronectin type III domain-containing protein n=1 Tax=Kribbella sp. NBC_01245 TaxID=2903578 RepID=UPI002E2BC658|nr:fibronectin type III domain-containing protein [Kribbella sp. NBC_01245]
MGAHRKKKTLTGLAAIIAIVASLLAVQQSATAATPVGPQTAAALNTAFNTYGDTSGEWSGADGTASVTLPDGRVAWLFSDSYIGPVNADHSRPKTTPMINNSIVIQTSAGLTDTIMGGTTTAPQAVMPPPAEGEFYWVQDGTVSGGKLRAIYGRYARSGQGNLDFVLKSSVVATFDATTLALESVTPVPGTPKIAWGAELLEDGATTYVYGSEYTTAGSRYAHVAKTSADLTQPWQYWNGTTWVTDEAESKRLLSGVGTAFGVQKVAGGFVLVTQQANAIFHPGIVAYPATNPTGPFAEPTTLVQAPEMVPGSSNIVYDAHVHPQLATSGKLLVSYNVNTLDGDANYADARIYRPRFIEVAWPRPVPDPSTLPAAPTGLTAAPQLDGSVKLTWQAVAGAASYRVYQRNVTGGQTHFHQDQTVLTTPAHTVSGLRSGEEYQFKVVAVDPDGESLPSATIPVTVVLDPPDAPTAVTATPDGNGDVVVAWHGVPNAWNYEVTFRNVTQEDEEFSLATTVGGTVNSFKVSELTDGDLYEFRVQTIAAGGSSAPSALAQATPHALPPPKPTGLTATALANGQIKLSWDSVGTGPWYWVYQRDVTAEDPEFSKLSLPISSGTTMNAGYLVDGHNYEFKVTSYTNAGESEDSNVVSAVAKYPPTPGVTGLTATPGDGKVVLNWNSAGEDVWYWIYQRDVTEEDATFTQLPLPISSGTTMTAGFLSNGHTYEFKIAAIADAGVGPQSAAVTARPMPPKPAVVTGVSATPQTDGGIRLNWTAQPSVFYWIWMRDATAGEAMRKLEWPTDKTTWDAELLKHGHRYEFRIVANNMSGDGPSSVTFAATSTYAKPAAPTNLRARAMGNAVINLDWDGPTGVYYWIYRRDVTAGEAFAKSSLPTDDTSANLGLMKAGHKYEFQVSAENQGGEGARSAIASATSYGGLPGAPTGLTATAGDGQVRLAWGASSTSGVLYNVYQRDRTNGQSWQRLPTPVNGLAITAGYLMNGHTYEFKVTASNAVGDSAASNVASARPLPPLPKAPTSIVASPRDASVYLDWPASTTPSVYYEVRYRAAGGTWKQMAYPIVDQTWLTVTWLSNGTTYEFQVRAANLAGVSAWSPSDTARPMPPLPVAPANLTAVAGNSQVSLDWPASVTPGVFYWVEYRLAGGGWTRLKYPIGNGITAWTITWLVNGKTYEFRVRSTNLAGDSAPSVVRSARPLPPLPPRAEVSSFNEFNAGTLEVGWNIPFLEQWSTAVYYRDLTLQGPTRRVVLGTSSRRAKLVLAENHYYDVSIAHINVRGEGPRSEHNLHATTFNWRSAAPRRQKNRDNGSNSSAIATILWKNLDCRNGVSQTVCFWYSPAAGRPMTLGDYLYYPHSESDLRKKLRCEATESAQLAGRQGASYGRGYGPHLMEHEAIHSVQYARYDNAAKFAFDYWRAGVDEDNRFEQEANLYWGSYLYASDVDGCPYSW